MTDYGYARAAVDSAGLTAQVQALRAAGLRRIYTDIGTAAELAGLAQLRSVVRVGDTLTVLQLDRIAGSVTEALSVLNGLVNAGVAVRSLADPVPVEIGPVSPAGAGAAAAVAALALAEPSYKRDRARRARSSAAGKETGRPKSLTPAQIAIAQQLQNSGLSLRAIAERLEVGHSTIARALAS